MEPFAQIDLVIPTLSGLVHGVRREQLDDSTPCDGWQVRNLLAHLVSGGRMFAGAFRGGPVTDISNPDTSVIGDDPGAAFDAAFADFDDAIRVDGALAQSIALPFGEIPGDVFVRLAAFDLLVHSWDVATATGQRFSPPAELVSAADEFARGAVGPEVRATGMFGPELEPPTGADRLEALVAFTGRKP